MLKNIKDFFIEIIQIIRRFMGPDLSESELLEDETNNEYVYQRLKGFGELPPEEQAILDEAMEGVVIDESNMSIRDALEEVRRDKLSLRKTERQNTGTRETTKPKVEKNQTRSTGSIDMDK